MLGLADQVRTRCLKPCHLRLAVLLSALGCAPEARVQLLGFAGVAQAPLMSKAEHVRDFPCAGTVIFPYQSCAQPGGYAVQANARSCQRFTVLCKGCKVDVPHANSTVAEQHCRMNWRVCSAGYCGTAGTARLCADLRSSDAATVTPRQCAEAAEPRQSCRRLTRRHRSSDAAAAASQLQRNSADCFSHLASRSTSGIPGTPGMPEALGCERL